MIRTVKDRPVVGDKIRKNFGRHNANTWTYFGEIRAIVDDHLIVRRWIPSKGYFLVVITPYDWEYGSEYFDVRRSRKVQDRPQRSTTEVSVSVATSDNGQSRETKK